MIKLLIFVQYLGRVSVHGMGVAVLRGCTQYETHHVLSTWSWKVNTFLHIVVFVQDGKEVPDSFCNEITSERIVRFINKCKRHWKFKQEALDRTVWRTCFGEAMDMS